MWISTRAQYGLRAMIEIGRRTGPVPLKVVSARQNISLHYLEQIIAQLRRGGLVRSVRGASGGYELARPAERISAYEIVVLLEGSIAPVACAEAEHTCEHEQVCGTQDLWRRVDTVIRAVLEASTVASLIAEAQAEEQGQLLQLTEWPEGG